MCVCVCVCVPQPYPRSLGAGSGWWLTNMAGPAESGGSGIQCNRWWCSSNRISGKSFLCAMVFLIKGSVGRDCLESRRLWVRIPPEEPFFYENRKEGSQVSFFALHVSTQYGVWCHWWFNYPGQLLDIEFEFTLFIRAN